MSRDSLFVSVCVFCRGGCEPTCQCILKVSLCVCVCVLFIVLYSSLLYLFLPRLCSSLCPLGLIEVSVVSPTQRSLCVCPLIVCFVLECSTCPRPLSSLVTRTPLCLCCCLLIISKQTIKAFQTASCSRRGWISKSSSYLRERMNASQALWIHWNVFQWKVLCFNVHSNADSVYQPAITIKKGSMNRVEWLTPDDDNHSIILTLHHNWSSIWVWNCFYWIVRTLQTLIKCITTFTSGIS